ncbi:carboxypeptidase M32 [Haloquadratum walsbyi]|jgi:carboxypeptidase Taq (EC:3.4.17.19). Metallo peptidase. MEROPS family M32|uniref:Metal-dependent carboxypeptidase n=1 Tax=Haloquadratum walsbyi J07HQW2 TaxID=1238425 RepID=U1PR87_9EURY|nr:carboxypeptidase M32 [Haloquadratum walsbyi]ERG96282.1 MAG: Zn-dependent carboxypeptidase [Haloquadratum walsbyi J07HQW2]
MSADAYATLCEQYEHVSNIQHARGVLSWDQQVTMPEDGTPARTAQLSALSTVAHDALTNDIIADTLETLRANSDSLSSDQKATVREIRRKHERATAVPESLIAEMSETASEALPVWESAKADDDFDAFAPYLQRHVELNREYADCIDSTRDPYAVLLEEFEPYLSLDHVESVLRTIRETLVPLIDEIRASETTLATDAFTTQGTYSSANQEALCRDVLTTLGYPWERGRLDTAPHPFSMGTSFDARVTTRFDETDPLGSVFSTIHEFGHASYTLGLSDDAYATPLGEDRDLSVHESQSRLWENHVGRSRAFWDVLLSQMNEHFPQTDSLSVREAYEAANQVYEDNLIRVNADELTYHLHVLIRYEIERALIDGDIDVAEVPAIWNNKYEEYLGIQPETDAEGCLQDIHWSHGNIGYFPTYSLGSAMAAQLYTAAEESIADLDGKIAAGSFDELREWLRRNVHQHGARYQTDELIKQATGSSFTADAFVSYVSKKYASLYSLDQEFHTPL